MLRNVDTVMEQSWYTSILPHLEYYVITWPGVL